MADSNETEFKKIRQLLLSASVETISKNLPAWFINSTKALNITEELGFLVDIVNILCYRLEKWISGDFRSHPLSLAEQRHIYNVFYSEGWLIQIALKYRVRVENRFQLLSRNSLILIEELKAPVSADKTSVQIFDDLTMKVPIWQIKASSLPTSAQIELELQKKNYSTTLGPLFELYSRCVLSDRSHQNFILLDIFEYIIYSVIKNMGSEGSINQNATLDKFDKSDKDFGNPSCKGLIELATNYIDFLVPVVIQVEPAKTPSLKFLQEAQSSPNLPKYKIGERMKRSIFSHCDEASAFSLIKLTCEIISSFWLPHASESALMASETYFGNGTDDVRYCNWKASNYEILGIKCFHILVKRFSITESWLEQKALTDFKSTEFDKDSFSQIKLREAVYEIIRGSCFNNSLVEAIAWVFGSKAVDIATSGSNMDLTSVAKLELKSIDLLVECWLEYIFPWTSKAIGGHSPNARTSGKISENFGKQTALPKEWEYRIQRISEIAVSDLYGPALCLFFTAVVPSFDLLAAKPCFSHYYKNFRNYSKVSSSSDSSAQNPSKSLDNLTDYYSEPQTQNPNQGFNTLNPIFPNSSLSLSGNLPRGTDAASPLKRAAIAAESVRDKVSNALGIQEHCTCNNDFDILSIILKVVSAIGTGFTKSVLASIDLAAFKKFSIKPSGESTRDTLWTRNILDFELKSNNYSIIRIKDGQEIFKSKGFGEFRLLDKGYKDKMPLIHELAFPFVREISLSQINKYPNFVPGSSRNSEYGISKRFYISVLNYYIPDHLNACLFVSHSRVIIPLLLKLVGAAQLAKGFAKSLDKAYMSKNTQDQTPLELRDLDRNESISNKVNQINEDLLESTKGFFYKFLDISNLHSFLFTNIDTVEPAFEMLSSAKHKSISYNLINNKLLFIVDEITNTFGISPTELEFVIDQIMQTTKPTFSPQINLSREWNQNPNILQESEWSNVQINSNTIAKPSSNGSVEQRNIFESPNYSLGLRSRALNLELNGEIDKPSPSSGIIGEYGLQSRKSPTVSNLMVDTRTNREPAFSPRKGEIDYSSYSSNAFTPASYESEYLLHLTNMADTFFNKNYQIFLNILIAKSTGYPIVPEVLKFMKKAKFGFRFLAAYNNLRFFGLIILIFYIFKTFFNLF